MIAADTQETMTMNEYNIVSCSADGLSINMVNLQAWSKEVTDILNEYIPNIDDVASVVHRLTVVFDKQTDFYDTKIRELNTRILELQKVCTYLDAQIQELKNNG